MNPADLPRALRGELRRHVRVPENTRLLWHIRKNGLVGQGRIRNISASGMLAELTSLDALPEKSVLPFDFNFNDTNYMPETGRLVWRKRRYLSHNKYLCGFEFNDLPEVLATRLNKKVSDGAQHMVKMWKIKRAIGIFLTIITIALIGYVVWLGGVIFQNVSRSNEGLLTTAAQQAGLTREYQKLYADTTRRLADVTLELNQTTALYQETQNQLQSTKNELSMVKSILSETEGLLTQTQARTIPQVSQVALTPGMVHNVQDGRALIASYRDRIEEVAAQINKIQYENHLARISALEERDRVRLMYGNRGYFMKSGQPVQVDQRQYEAASFNALLPGQAPNPDSKVRVNVTVFQ